MILLGVKMRYLPYILLVFLLLICGVSIISLDKKENKNYDYLRIHIVANSNDTIDQEVKFEIKNKIVDYLTPYLADCKSSDEAKSVIDENLKIITFMVDDYLENNGFTYSAKLEFAEEYFPTRYYENCLLDAGVYNSLGVRLGEAKGDNWWCVVYPPLCFVNKNSSCEQDIVYQSKIMEIIKKYFR